VDGLERGDLGGMTAMPLRGRPALRVAWGLVVAFLALAYAHEPAYRVDYVEPSSGRPALHTWFEPGQDRRVFFESATILPEVESSLYLRLYDRATGDGAAMARAWRDLGNVAAFFRLAALVAVCLGVLAYGIRSRVVAAYAAGLGLVGFAAYGVAAVNVAAREQRWLFGSGDLRWSPTVPSAVLGLLLTLAFVALVARRPGKARPR